jgi:ATP-binding cassette, subfamily B, bacterial MsbA
MKNFLRTLRIAGNYRIRLAVSLICALVAALLWGLMFTCIDPVLSILRTGDSLQARQERRIEETQKKIRELEPIVDDLRSRQKTIEELKPEPNLAPDKQKDFDEFVEREKRALANDLARIESKLETARNDMRWLLNTKRYFDDWMPANPFGTLVWLFFLVVVAVALRGLFEFGQETLVGSVVNRTLYDVRNRFFRNTIHLDVNQFGEKGTSEVMSRLTNDTEMVGQGLKTLFGRVVGEPLKAISCVMFASMISWQLTLLFLILVPVAAFILTKVGRMMKRATRRLLERMSSIYKILQETFMGIRVVKAFTREAHERRRFHEATRDYYRKSMMVVYLDALSGPVIELLGVIAVAAALIAGAYLVLEKRTHLFGLRLSDHPLEAEALLQLYAYLVAIADPVRKLSSVYTRMQSGFAAADRIFEFMDRRPRVQANPDGRELDGVHLGIEFRDICFSYDPASPILTDVRLHVRAGETVAIIGKNGCGKTTLLNLLPRFYDPDHGAILIDGVDIRRMNLRNLRKQIGVVTQEALLFEDTIFNNIRYARQSATQEEVEAAARMANAHEFIMGLPNGYQTLMSEQVWKASGGQKQRIALARALLRDPSILILDEFTSAADAESDLAIHRALHQFKRDRTVFVITHKLNTLEIADRIVVMDEQRIVAVGTHNELMLSCSLYQRLHEAQKQKLVA